MVETVPVKETLLDLITGVSFSETHHDPRFKTVDYT